MTKKNSQAGFGYLELLASMVITGIVVAASTQLYLGGLRVASDAAARTGDSSLAVTRAHLRQDLQRLDLRRASNSWQSGPLVLGSGSIQVGWQLENHRLIRRHGESSTVLLDGGVRDWRWRRRGDLVELELELESRILAPTRGIVDQRFSRAGLGKDDRASRPTRRRTIRLSFHTARGARQW